MQFLDKERMKSYAARGGVRFGTSRPRPIYALACSSLTASSFNFFLTNSTLSQKAPAFCALICGGLVSKCASFESSKKRRSALGNVPS